jgi:DNA modification methylase
VIGDKNTDDVPVETPVTLMLKELKNEDNQHTARAETMELLSFTHEKTGTSSELNKVASKKLAIQHDRTCKCAANHLNCLTAKEWLKSQLGVWEFYYNGRDVRDKDIHPAVFPISLAKRVIEVFTHKGELVIDPFTGISTTLLAARDLDRNAVGFDINPKYIEFSKKRLSESALIGTSQQIPILDDARNIAQYFDNSIASLCFTSPPYANLLNRQRLNKSRRGDQRKNGQYLKVEQYSQDERDLGVLAMEKYAEAIMGIYRDIKPILKPKGHAVINIPDMWWSDGKHGKRIPLHIALYNAMKEAGYELRNTIIWDRRNIVNRVGIFGYPSNYITMGTTFEYLMDFWVPPT